MPGLYNRIPVQSKTRSVRSVASPNAVGLGGRNGNVSHPREAFHVGKKEDDFPQASIRANQPASLRAVLPPVGATTPSQRKEAPIPDVDDEEVFPNAAVELGEEEAPEEVEPIPNTSRTPGIIPQTSTIPSGSVPYFRTGWTGEAVVGKGFMRETNQFKPTALSFDSAPPENIVTTQNQRFSVISKAQEFANSLAVGASVAVEAYGAEVSAAVEVNKSTQFSENSVTVSLMRSYKSDPILFVDPISARVELDAPAKELLRTQGPKVFHEKHGTHYIAGYTVGGLFSGYVQMRYSSKAKAESAKATVEFAVGKLGVSASGTASFESNSEKFIATESKRANYSAIGWNVAPFDFSGNIKAPPTVTDMDTLLEAANQMETDDGQRLEAVLASYQDLADYRSCLAEFVEKDAGDQRREDRERKEQEGEDFVPSTFEDFTFLPKEDFIVISQLLNSEMLCLDFVDRSIDDLLLSLSDVSLAEIEAKAHELRLRGFRVQRDIRKKFSIDADARENWLALAAYIDHVNDPAIPGQGGVADPNQPILFPIDPVWSIHPMLAKDPVRPIDPPLAERGRRLANAIFECEDIEKDLDALVEQVKFPESDVTG